MSIDIMEITLDDLRKHRNLSRSIVKWSEYWWTSYLYRWETCYIAVDDDDEIVGFQTVNSDKQTVTIEIHPEHRGRNIAFTLIEASGSTKPARNDNPTFWAKVAQAFN